MDHPNPFIHVQRTPVLANAVLAWYVDHSHMTFTSAPSFAGDVQASPDAEVLGV